MHSLIVITLLGPPVPKKAGRAALRANGRPYVFSPTALKIIEARESIRAMVNFRPFNAPYNVACKLTVTFYVLTMPYNKPDIDNLTTFVLDAVTGSLISDNALVVELHAMKLYDAMNPRTDITLELLH